MGRYASRIQLDVISPPSPQIASPGQEIMRLVRLVPFDVHPVQGKVDESGLLMMRIEIDNDNNQVALIRRALAETEEHVVIDRMELDIAVILKRLILFPDAIHKADHLP